VVSAVEPLLPGISAYRTHVPIKVTNVQLLSPQVLGSQIANGADDNNTSARDMLLKGTTYAVI